MAIVLFSGALIGCALFLPSSEDTGAGLVGYVGCNSVGDGHGVILKTIDAGVTWTRVGSSELPDVNLPEVRAIDKLTALATGMPSGGYGLILKTTDGGATWQRLGTSATIPNVEMAGIGAVNTQTYWVVGFSGTILKTINGGTTWVSQEAAGITANLSAVSAVDANNAWIIGDNQNGYSIILHTTDGGTTWTREGTKEVLPWALIDVSAYDAATCWACGTDGKVIRTVDSGTTWSTTETGHSLIHYNGIIALGKDTAWTAVDDDLMCFTSDGGQTYDRINIPTSEGVGYALLTVAATDTDHLWTAGTWFNSPQAQIGTILRSTDKGVTWQRATTPVNASFRRVSFVGSRQ
ncbi:MAG: YCF48-related protein [bacterium]